MTNCLTWCWQELLERWDIYTKTSKQKFTCTWEMLLYNSIPTNTFSRKNHHYTRPEKRDRDEKAKNTRKQRCVLASKKEPVFHDHVAS